MELNPTSMDSSLPLDLPLPNLPMVKEENETDASNSLIKEEKAVSSFFYTVSRHLLSEWTAAWILQKVLFK